MAVFLRNPENPETAVNLDNINYVVVEFVDYDYEKRCEELLFIQGGEENPNRRELTTDEQSELVSFEKWAITFYADNEQTYSFSFKSEKQARLFANKNIPYLSD